VASLEPQPRGHPPGGMAALARKREKTPVFGRIDDGPGRARNVVAGVARQYLIIASSRGRGSPGRAVAALVAVGRQQGAGGPVGGVLPWRAGTW